RMRNLKRALSLTLASVMLLGMMIVGTSAVSFNDADEISNVTAATILQEIGVMVGDGENFMPDQIVTRGQMAIIVCKLLYGDKLNVSQFEGSTQYTDVKVGDYFNGYVNLATSLGIISGYGNGQFGPGDPVTTAQAALMLTKALGYYQNKELSGDWGTDALTAITLATRLTMFEGIKAPASNEGLTRDNVAVMSFNTLTRATPVKFNPILGEYYTVGGGVTNGVQYIDAYEYGKQGTEYTNTLGFTIYGLYISNEPTDDFGRPADEWSYERGGVIGTFTDEPIAVYTASASRGTLYNLIGSSSVNSLAGTNNKTNNRGETQNTLSVYVDGVAQPVYTYTNNNITVNGDGVGYYFERNNSAGAHSGKGVVTEVYQDANNNVTIVYINTYLMKATADYRSANGTINVEVKTQPAQGLAGTRSSVEPTSVSTNMTTNVSVTTLGDDEFPVIKEYKQGDYILYTATKAHNGQGSWTIQSVQKADMVTGKVEAYSRNTDRRYGTANYYYAGTNASGAGNGASGSVTIDGTKYDYARYAPVSGDKGCDVEYSVNNTASIVVDAYGYAIYVADASLSVGNYIYVEGIGYASGATTGAVASVYRTDGTYETIDVRRMSSASADTNDILDAFKAQNTHDRITYETPGEIRVTVNGAPSGLNGKTWSSLVGWYSYTRNSRGQYTLNRAPMQGNISADIETNRVQIAGAVPGNDNTIFVVLDKNGDVKLYTGIANVPKIENYIGSNSAWLRHDETSRSASVVFVDASDTGSKIKNPNAEYLYLVNQEGHRVEEETNETIYTWAVMINGEQKNIDSKTLSDKNWAGKLFEDYSTSDEGKLYEEGSEFNYANNRDNIQVGMTMAGKSTIGADAGTLSIYGQKALKKNPTTGAVADYTDGRTDIRYDSETTFDLVLRPTPGSALKQLNTGIMNNRNATWEAQRVNADTLDSTFSKWLVEGTAYIIMDDENDSDYAKNVIILVTDVQANTGLVRAELEDAGVSSVYDINPAMLAVNATGDETVKVTGNVTGGLNNTTAPLYESSVAALESNGAKYTAVELELPAGTYAMQATNSLGSKGLVGYSTGVRTFNSAVYTAGDKMILLVGEGGTVTVAFDWGVAVSGAFATADYTLTIDASGLEIGTMPTAPEALEESKTGDQIKGLDDGVYTPYDKNFDSNGDGSDVNGAATDNVIIKFTTTVANKETVLTITDSDGDTVYTETGSTFAVGGHFFYLNKYVVRDGLPEADKWAAAYRAGGEKTDADGGMVVGATYSYTITEDGAVIAQGSFIA
ncbi:MAG: S-layer homology domain-containing protein, partial [Lawsonibacter sp.]|nr:S-layer homology domain-containing protein [Lawsonibacter sp.]